MEKRKVILLAVAGVCIVGAGVMLYFNMADAGPAPTPPPSLEETFKENPEAEKAYKQQLEFQEREKQLGRPPAGS